MAFDREAFLAGFLNQVSSGIAQKREEAEEYKEKQEAAFERNQNLIRTRNARASQAVNLGRQALEYLPEGGNSKAMVRTAMASGMTGIQEFRDKLANAHAEAGLSAGERLSINDVEAIISMPNIPSIDQSLIDMSLEQFAKETYGVSAKAAPVTEDEPSLIGQLFGVGAKDRVKRELREEQAFEGMSIADVNAAARMNEFNSLIPNAVMSFSEMERFGRNDGIKFSRTIADEYDTAKVSRTADDAALKARTAVLEAYEAQPGVNAPEEELERAEEMARTAYAQGVIKRLIETEAGIYGEMLLNNSIAAAQIKELMGESYYFNLYDDYNPVTEEEKEAVGLGLGPSSRSGRRGMREQEETTTPETTEETPTTEEPEVEPEEPTVTEDETPAADGRYPSQTKKVKPINLDEAPGFFPLSEYRKWKNDNEGKYDLETGDPIYVRPRPPEGGPKKRYPLFPGSTSSRKTEPMTDAEYWDMQHADTHEATGYPKGAEFIE